MGYIKTPFIINTDYDFYSKHEEMSRELISQFKNIDIIQEFYKAQEKQRLYEEKILRIKELMQIE